MPPPHISGLSLRKFRSFSDSGLIPLKPLTIIVGPNSAGKSTIASAILLIIQSHLLPLWRVRPVWTGQLIDLGCFADSVHKHNSKSKIQIDLDLSDPSHRASTRLSFEISAGRDPIGTISALSLQSLTAPYQVRATRLPGQNREYRFTSTSKGRSTSKTWTDTGNVESNIGDRFERIFMETAPAIAPREFAMLFRTHLLMQITNGTQRVASGRLPPSRWYARSTSASRRDSTLFDRVDPSMLLHDHDVPPREQASEAARMSELLERFGLADGICATNLSAYHSSLDVIDRATNSRENLADVGYGVSQCLPIISALVSRRLGPLFVEQPEIHLHPSAQAEVARVLALASKERQVVIETHAERVVNTARIMVAEGALSCNDLQILFVARSRHGSKVTPIEVSKEGNFETEWPGGFFEERFRDTMALAELQQTKAKH